MKEVRSNLEAATVALFNALEAVKDLPDFRTGDELDYIRSLVDCIKEADKRVDDALFVVDDLEAIVK